MRDYFIHDGRGFYGAVLKCFEAKDNYSAIEYSKSEWAGYEFYVFDIHDNQVYFNDLRFSDYE